MKKMEDMTYDELIAAANAKKMEAIAALKQERKQAMKTVDAIDKKLAALGVGVKAAEPVKAAQVKKGGKRRGGLSKEILAYLKQHPNQKPRQIAAALSYGGNMGAILFAMVKAGKVKKTADGLYSAV